MLVAVVPPFMLRTPDNPAGVPIGVFDGLRAASPVDRWQLYRDLAGHRNALECIAAFSATDSRRDLDGIDMPTLVIHGDDDQVVPFEVDAKASAARIAGATFTVMSTPERQQHEDHRPDPRLLGDPAKLEYWIERYQRAGYHVIAPAYPWFEVEVEALNADPSPIEALTVPAIISHLESVVGQLDEPPIIMGHSAGGAFTQVLLDHGFGAAGVALNSAPTEGVAITPLSRRLLVTERAGGPESSRQRLTE